MMKFDICCCMVVRVIFPYLVFSFFSMQTHKILFENTTFWKKKMFPKNDSSDCLSENNDWLFFYRNDWSQWFFGKNDWSDCCSTRMIDLNGAYQEWLIKMMFCKNDWSKWSFTKTDCIITMFYKNDWMECCGTRMIDHKPYLHCKSLVKKKFFFNC